MSFVYAFSEGSADMKSLLGGKGAGLAEMLSLGIPVPDGFTVTTEACIAASASGSVTRSARCSCPCAPARSSRCPG
jgi:phosphoenolpyruvate synthase/pyruvate phosphate dikinase